MNSLKKKGFCSHQPFDGYETRGITEENAVAMDPSPGCWELYISTSKKQLMFETNELNFESKEQRLFLTLKMISILRPRFQFLASSSTAQRGKPTKIYFYNMAVSQLGFTFLRNICKGYIVLYVLLVGGF